MIFLDPDWRLARLVQSVRGFQIMRVRDRSTVFVLPRAFACQAFQLAFHNLVEVPKSSHVRPPIWRQKISPPAQHQTYDIHFPQLFPGAIQYFVGHNQYIAHDLLRPICEGLAHQA